MPNVDELAIGDFSKPVVPNKSKASPEGDRLDQAEAKIAKEAAEAEKGLKPLQAYEDKLKELGVSREEAARIVDAVLMQGYFAEDVPITSRIKVRLRTRGYRDTKRAQDHLEQVRPVYDAHYNEILGRFTLAASIEQLGSNKFEHPGPKATGEEIEKAFADRLAFVDSMLDATMRILLVKLYKFDTKIRVVLEEGALENF